MATEHAHRGANNIDDHFKNMPFENNLPVLMGLISLWNISFLGYPALAILPYCQVTLCPYFHMHKKLAGILCVVLPCYLLLFCIQALYLATCLIALSCPGSF
jgi:hypothetical protein